MEASTVRGAVEEALAVALAAGEVRHAFQPIWRLDPPMLHGFEALARFPGGVLPDAVWALARERGEAARLDVISVRCALAEAYPLVGRLFVNVDASWFGMAESERVQGEMIGLLTDEALVYEVTEQESAGHMGFLRWRALLERRGVLLALDDAGSGASDPTRLAILRPRYVKLDRSLVTDWLQGTETDQLPMWVHMAESVGAVTVAEGIEDPFAAERLRAVGARYVQGFAYGRPGVAADWTREAVLGVLPALAPTGTG